MGRKELPVEVECGREECDSLSNFSKRISTLERARKTLKGKG